MIRADTELRCLSGIGPRRAERLAASRLRTVEDLLYVLPMRYEDRRNFARVAELLPGGPDTTLNVEVESSRLIRTRRRGFTIFEARVKDATGKLKVIWYNQPYLERVIQAGKRVVLFGRPVAGRYEAVQLENPDYEYLEGDDAEGVHTGRIVPVYRKLGDLQSRFLRGIFHATLQEMERDSLAPLVPPAIAERRGLIHRWDALHDVHFPPADVTPRKLVERDTPAQRTLAFEEIFLLQLALASRRHGVKHEKRGIAYELPDALRGRLGGVLPFKLTDAQQKVLKEIGADLRSEHPMNRLLQGDVGSGKTAVALLTLLVAVENGYQGALMVPTEILAEQHARNIDRLLQGSGLDCPTALLTGSLRAAERRAALGAIANGEAKLAIGTHALFESGVAFHRLGLAVIDEQHRFGVLQRAALVDKGLRPDVLVMTATPIPRTMALTLYGDLDLSVIDELPPGRTPVTTVVRGEDERDKVYRGVVDQVRRGRQAYVVVPLVEETAKSDLKAATEFADKLRKDVLPDLEIGMLHGRMKGRDKDAVMQRFVAGEIQVLVATTVIEVGVDVPNATVMIVEHAERFGLSQLHQLRGRVGRGSERSYCVLMVGDEEHGREARERLAVMAQTTDGFLIAEKDLEIRGPGMVFGTQQHGLTDLQFIADVLRAPELLDAARAEARAMIEGTEEQQAHAAKILESLSSKWKRRL
ncbi:MAG: ATP-dependent DNA helicase RecG, partial [bacterium]|nr:ATP-dependent DNA helicase RecG [bacterium]